jgi:hypothetical protein
MRTSNRQAGAALALFALLCTGVSLAGCGSSTSSTPHTAVVNVTRAAYVTGQTPGFRVAMAVSVGGLGQSATTTANGSFTLPGPRGQMTMTLAGHQLEQVMAWPMVYVHVAGHTLHGKPWVSVDAQRAVESLGLSVSPGQSVNPTEALRYLRASSTVTRVGSEAVRGVRTTHYHAVADLQKYASLASASERGQAAQGVRLLERLTGQSTLPLEAWIDEQGRVRRVKLALPVCTPAGKLSTSISFELFDFGLQRPVKVPAASEVTDITEEAAAKASQALQNLHC